MTFDIDFWVIGYVSAREEAATKTCLHGAYILVMGARDRDRDRDRNIEVDRYVYSTAFLAFPFQCITGLSNSTCHKLKPSYLRLFALAVPSSWNHLLPDIHTVHDSCSLQVSAPTSIFQ